MKPLRERLRVTEPPCALITQLAEELGHSPQMTLSTYAHVIDELRGFPQLPAEQEIARARSEVAERGHRRMLREALG